MLSVCTFNSSAMSGSDWFVQCNLRWERDICTSKRFTFAPLCLCSRSETTQGETLQTLEDMALTQVTAWLNPTHVRSHMPTDISYTVNVKMLKICTFGYLKNIPEGVFFKAVL